MLWDNLFCPATESKSFVLQDVCELTFKTSFYLNFCSGTITDVKVNVQTGIYHLYMITASSYVILYKLCELFYG